MKTPLLLLCLSAALLTACRSTNSRLLPYSGEQQQWPTATGSFVDTTQAVPVYFGLPPKPYTYLARIDVTARKERGNVIARAADDARDKGADALIVMENTERAVGSSGFANGVAIGSNGTGYGFGSSSSRVRYGGQVTAIAIQWKR